MCGIVGKAVNISDILQIPKPISNSVLDCIRHRGPDKLGEYQSENVWLGHARLSIIDLSDAANQPMQTPDGRYVICYNGEVYNFAEIIRTLKLSNLQSNSDTEVVLQSFAKLGKDAITLFNGMFAFAIFDKLKQKLLIARDRLGIKPLYYHFNENEFSFASEIRPLQLLISDSKRMNNKAFHEWLYFGNTLGDQTLYCGIHKLLPGHYIEFDLKTSKINIDCYWSPERYIHEKNKNLSVKESIQSAQLLLEQAVKRQLVSDVPIGIFLSGGIDSSAITAFASKHYNSRISTYTASFDYDKGVNEITTAKGIAELFGTNHHEVHISGFEISDIVEKMIMHHGFPFGDAANIPLYLISTKTNEKVILQGDGGDEMFGGYSRYSTLYFYKFISILSKLGSLVNILTPKNAAYYRRQRYLNIFKGESIADVMSLLLTEEDKFSNPANIFSDEFRNLFIENDPFSRYRACLSMLNGKDILSQMFIIDSMIILPDIFLEKVDRSTMAASIEVRVPFLDNDLVDFCLTLPGSQKVPWGQRKWLLKKALRGIVPDKILYGKKTGFGVPYGYWLRGSLKTLFFDKLLQFQNEYPGILNSKVIQKLYNEHISRYHDHSFLLWKILNLMIWSLNNRVIIIH